MNLACQCWEANARVCVCVVVITKLAQLQTRSGYLQPAFGGLHHFWLAVNMSVCVCPCLVVVSNSEPSGPFDALWALNLHIFTALILKLCKNIIILIKVVHIWLRAGGGSAAEPGSGPGFGALGSASDAKTQAVPRAKLR